MLPVFVLIIAGLVNILVFLLLILSYTTNILMPFQLIEIIIMVLALGFFDYLVIEKALCLKKRKTFKYVIHVNGIRG